MTKKRILSEKIIRSLQKQRKARLLAQAIEAQRAETVQQGSVHESPVPEGNAP